MSNDNQPPRLTLTDLHRFIPREDRSEIPSTPKSLPPEANVGKVVSASLHAEYAMRLIAAYCRRLKDALNLYLPLPAADRFHASTCRIRLLNGSNQAGKSLSAMAEFARIVRGMDPYKKRSAKNLVTLSIGKDQKHVGQVMWRKLWMPGEFEIVKDEQTGAWRSVRPDPNDPLHVDPSDLARKREWQPSPPLIPPSCVDRIAWEDKAAGVPSLVVFNNGTESWFCTSNGEPRQGIQVDLANIDEEVNGKYWLPEIWPRLVKRDGIFFWSYTPQESTPEAYALYQRFENGDPGVRAFPLLIEDNPYLTDEAKIALYRDYASQGAEQVRVRWYGEHAIASRVVYPEFLEEFHEVDAFPIPHNWMRIATIDPGTTTAAALFGAVPPHASHLDIYDELVVKNDDADAFARAFREKAGTNVFEVRIIDKKAGDQRSMGRSNTVAEHYQEAFERAGIPAARISGRGFSFGTPDVQARELSVKRFLNEQLVRLHRGKTSQLVRQIKGRLRDIRNPERRESRTEHDLCDDLEYMIAYFDGRGLYYTAPPSYKPSTMSPYDRSVMRFFDRDMQKERRRSTPSRIASSY